MVNRLTEKDWITESGLRAVVLFLSDLMPHRCGYVELPDSAELEYVDYDEVDVMVHGGLTYAGKGIVEDNNNWWLGFDAMHYNDLPDWGMGETMLETEEERNLYDQMKKISFMSPDGGEVRTLEYMVAECEELATQLKDII